MTPNYNDITQHETEALKHDFNMSDAHTHQSQSSTQEDIIRQLPMLWHEAEQTKQYDMEQKFLQNFFRLHGQHSVMQDNNPLLVYASSIAIVITANYLMKQKMSVSLMHPCFDNLTDILKHMEVPLSPLEEEWLWDPNTIYQNLVENIHTDALFIVDPNNPTGFTLTGTTEKGQDIKKGFLELIRYAKDYNKLLIFDFCFASFLIPDSTHGIFDIYKELNDSGVRYIAYEDTGKTWPLQDTKVAILLCSKDLYEDIYPIHSSYLLNVSPFILNLVNAYVLDSERDNFASVTSLLDQNRMIATNILQGSFLEPLEQKAKTSVIWCKITRNGIHASTLKTYLENSGVHVLAGTYFFWHNNEQGEQYIRIALARDTPLFTKAMEQLRVLLDLYKN